MSWSDGLDLVRDTAVFDLGYDLGEWWFKVSMNIDDTVYVKYWRSW